MTLHDYHAEYTALTQRIEAIQAEQRQIEEEARAALQKLQQELSDALSRRFMVAGAIEALTPKV
jgi:hypothetical protein